jgi:hypothetical protein
MALRKKGFSSAEKIHIPEMIGEEISAYYLGSEELDKPFPHVVHHFVMPDGRKRDIMGFTNLDRAILDETDPVLKNQMCVFSYKGKVKAKTTYGMKDVHQVDFAVDDDDFYLPPEMGAENIPGNPPEEKTEKEPF